MTLEATQITKSYSGVPVLRGVDLTVADGEIHALLGANGAGKSTLIKCISGAARADSGEIAVDGEPIVAVSPKHMRAAGIAVIYQDLSLAMSLRLYENVFLGRELCRGALVRRRRQIAEARQWLQTLGLDVDPRVRVDALGNAELQVVEIIKALQANAKVLVLDEPTSSLTEKEATRLIEQLKRLRAQRLPILYVTHRLSEVFDIADRVTVLRSGEVVLARQTADVSHEQLVTAIAGHGVESGRNVDSHASEDVVLTVDELAASGIGPISFDVRAGEILGVFGLVGSGRTELLTALFGARRLRAGRVAIDARQVRLDSPSSAVKAGIALVPADRRRQGVFNDLTARENMLLRSYSRLAHAGLRRPRAEHKVFDQLANRLQLRPRAPRLAGRAFSGGNQQKLVLGRWLQETERCRLLLLDEPTQGVDVGARSDLYATLRQFSASGAATIVTSSEPDELRQLADRVIVLSRGRVVGTLSGSDITDHRLLALAHLGERGA